MPVYKQFKYYKIRDCPSCRFYKFNECHQPVPNDFNCNFITRKEFVHKYYFKTSINGRTFVRRGFRLKKDAEKAEMQFRKEIIGENYFIDKSKRFPTYNADFHPHMLRASICTHLQEKGTPIEEISKYLGHEKIKVTETYYVKESQHKKEQVTEALEGIMKEII